jgi:hypothetical protein
MRHKMGSVLSPIPQEWEVFDLIQVAFLVGEISPKNEMKILNVKIK